MPRRVLVLVLVLLGFLAAAHPALAGPAVPATAAEKSYRADRYDVLIAVQPDRSLAVTETVVFRFEGGPFTRVYRQLQRSRTDGITDIVASLDGTVLPRGRRAGNVEIDRDEGPRITWHFAPTSDETHTFELRYRVAGAVEQTASGNLLQWTVLPTPREYPIDASRVTITYPAQASLVAAPAVEPPTARLMAADSSVVLDAASLGPNATLEATLPFGSTGFASQPPGWQRRSELNRQYFPTFAVLTLVLFASGIAGLVVFLASRRRPAVAAQDHDRSSPPDDLAPGLAGTLLQTGSRPGWTQAFATVVDLADRGVLAIEELPPHRWGRRDFVLRQRADRSGLQPHEKGALALLFEGKQGWQDSVKLSELRQHLVSRWKRYRDGVNGELVSSGLLDPERQNMRRGLRNLALALLALSGLGFVVAGLLVGRYGPSPLLLPAGLDVLAVVMLISAAVLSPLSDSGTFRAAAWQAFRQHLKSLTKTETAASSGLFARYLAYAAAFGLLPAWTRAFTRRDPALVLPPWFRPLAGAERSGQMAAFSAFIAVSASAGSGGAPGASGAGGAGGGGASGAS